jgi:peptide-methionine (S)-S-oxide reductase
MEKIVLGGGCFWCLDASYKLIKGVLKVEQGYAGGTVPNPTYAQVCTGTTGHAEVVQITFKPSLIKLEDILDIFWTIHDPTTLNRQSYDVGTQYRSIILFDNEKQRPIIEISRAKAQKFWKEPIVTEIKPLEKFYSAEDYQNDYEASRPDYCQIIINPKLTKLRQKFNNLLK